MSRQNLKIIMRGEISMQSKLAYLTAISVTLILTVTGCHKKTDTTADMAASATASQAVPMSAAPADDNKNPAVINENTAALDAGPDAAASAATMDSVASGNDAVEEGGADNSAMDKITENDKVVDNEPASPNAPKAADEGDTNETSPSPSVGNQKVGQ